MREYLPRMARGEPFTPPGSEQGRLPEDRRPWVTGDCHRQGWALLAWPAGPEVPSTVRAVVLEAAFPVWLEAAAGLTGTGDRQGRCHRTAWRGPDRGLPWSWPLTRPCHWDTRSAPIPTAGVASRATALRSCGGVRVIAVW